MILISLLVSGTVTLLFIATMLALDVPPPGGFYGGFLICTAVAAGGCFAAMTFQLLFWQERVQERIGAQLCSFFGDPPDNDFQRGYLYATLRAARHAEVSEEMIKDGERLLDERPEKSNE